jgi:ABC-type bacteriocin/lantibiotic exporter with double-glycine peptidase domain
MWNGIFHLNIVSFLILFPFPFPFNEVFAESIPDSTWNWIPAWRDQADCGPNALYILMKLEGYNVTLAEIKELVPLDPVKGCSMETLLHASEQLGFTIEARFVKPGEVSKLPRPFILHGITSHENNLGHFIVVVDYDKKKNIYAQIDPYRETFGWTPEPSVLYGYTGYVLVPKYPVSKKWNFFAGMSLILCGFRVFCFTYRRKAK